MNDRQENRLGSYRTTGQVLTDNAALFAAIVALVTQHQNLLDSVSLIDSLAMLQTSNTTGITEAKAELQRQMVDNAMAVGGAVEAYASTVGNLALKARAHIVGSKFTHLGKEFVTAVDECFDLLAPKPEAFPVVYRSARLGSYAGSLSRGVSRLSKFHQDRCGDSWAKESATVEAPPGRIGR